jgi:ribonuclease HII
MGFLIGTDEAGYGPNLGPLIISATVWQVADSVKPEDLYQLLGEVVVPTPGRVANNSTARVAMADSKTLYQSGKGLKHLERGVLAALAVLDRRPITWCQLWDALVPESADSLRSIRWYADYDTPLPLEADAAETEPLARSLADGFATAGVRLVDIRSRAVFPREFNQLVEHYGSKGTALSHTTLDLTARLVAPLKSGPIGIVCDKHGGRNRYSHLLAEHFPEWLIEIYGEGRAKSVYRFGPADRRVEIRFQSKAESCLPAALASMASKYLRELAMRALNAFWCRRVDGLHPTAGYPQDAKRFKTAIAQTQAELEIDDSVLWRRK